MSVHAILQIEWTWLPLEITIAVFFFSAFGGCLAEINIELRGLHSIDEKTANSSQAPLSQCNTVCDDGDYTWMTPRGYNELNCIQSVLKPGRTAAVSLSIANVTDIFKQDFTPSYSWGELVQTSETTGPYCAVVQPDNPYAYKFVPCNDGRADVCACRGKQLFAAFLHPAETRELES